MRMSSFVVGGLVGAAAVMYFSRNNKSMALGSLNQVMGRTKNSMMDFASSAMSQGMNKNMSSHKQSKADKQAGLDKVEKIINEDPSVKAEVDKIMMSSQNNTKPAAELSHTTH